jgi:hypothetical protein
MCEIVTRSNHRRRRQKLTACQKGAFHKFLLRTKIALKKPDSRTESKGRGVDGLR